MEQESRRPGEGDGSYVLLGGERAEPTPNSFKTQFPIIWKHWLREPETAVQS